MTFVGHPFDLIKVRLQTSSQYRGNARTCCPARLSLTQRTTCEVTLFTLNACAGMVDCASQTFKKDGIRGMYRGMSSPMLSSPPCWATYAARRICRRGCIGVPSLINIGASCAFDNPTVFAATFGGLM
jgi:hypothetical protein